MGPRPKILVVDDDQTILRLLARALGSACELSFGPNLTLLDYVSAEIRQALDPSPVTA